MNGGGSAMLNFTSARYLGLRHARGSLPDWDDLTTGMPAALGESPAALAVARRLASLVGVGRATLGTSTLHLFWDLFGILAAGPLAVTVYADAATYPVARWGAERAAAAGVPVRIFAHHDPDHLRLWLRRDAARERRPVVIADGFCPGCGRVAPLADYAAAARGRGGLLVIDDTQALGVLGRAPEAVPPYGAGGGGSLRVLDTVGPGVVVVASLAKAFGAPLAVLGGDATMVDRIEQQSETRVHCSPPSAAAVAAAARAAASTTLSATASAAVWGPWSGSFATASPEEDSRRSEGSSPSRRSSPGPVSTPWSSSAAFGVAGSGRCSRTAAVGAGRGSPCSSHVATAPRMSNGRRTQSSTPWMRARVRPERSCGGDPCRAVACNR